MTRSAIYMAMLVASAITGCVADAGDGEEQPPPARLSCSVAISPGLVTYQVDATGKLLTLGPGQADEAVLDRFGAPSTAIYGTWLADDVTRNGILFQAEMTFETRRMRLKNRCTAKGKTAVAEASSPATIGDSAVEVLQAASDMTYAD